MSGTAGNGVMLALLAAGQSRRFGDTDKLTALLHGKMLGLHAAATLAQLPHDYRIVIASSADHSCAADWSVLGYDIIVNEHADQGQASSVECAVEHALACGVTALCLCLADTPYVTGQHIETLSQTFEALDRKQIVASSDDGNTMPPAIFPANQFEALQQLQGDQGARQLLKTAHLIPAEKNVLLDIDTPEMLEIENRKGPRT